MNAPDRSLPSGRQHEIAGHGYTAVVTEVGASLRVLRRGDRDVVVPWDSGAVRPVSRGALLAPWPNRVADGRWSWEGTSHQLPLTEVPRGNAIHGLVSWRPWALADAAADAVTLTCRLHPSSGYPFDLDLAVTYALAEDGLTTALTATNRGSRDAPYGCAPHPYLVAGPGLVDDWVLDLPAERVLEVDPDRLLPRRPPVTVPVSGGRDFRAPRVVGDATLDDAFTAVSAGTDGRARVRVTHPGTGTGAEIAFDPARMPWVQVHTADRPDPALHRVGLAVEPMTCPPDALGSGTDLVRLAPGGSHTASWSIRAL